MVIGVTYPMSGANAQIGVDAQHAYVTATDIINNKHDFELPLAKDAGLPGLGGANFASYSPTMRAIPRRAVPKPSA